MTLLRKISVFLVALNLAFAQGKKPLTAEDLIQMKNAGLDEQTMVKAIETNGVAIDTSGQGLVTLKTAGLSDNVIRAVLTGRSPDPATPSAPTPSGILPDEVGVHVRRDTTMNPLQVELVNVKQAGSLRSLATMGIGSTKLKGTLTGGKSSMQLSVPIEILVRCPDGVSPIEYRLLRLDAKKKSREFTLGKVGMTATFGVDDVITAKFERIGPSTHRTVLADLKDGEYGFFAPGPMSTASSGKMYTFGVSK